MIAPGEVAYAADVATHQLVQATATGSLTLVSEAADVPGATVTVVTTRPNAHALIIATVDFQSLATGATTGVVTINVDGVDVGPQAICNQSNVAAGLRVTAATSYVAPLASPGSHVIKLRGSRATGTDGALRINSLHTQLTVLVVE